jgi:hypothetical protein
MPAGPAGSVRVPRHLGRRGQSAATSGPPARSHQEGTRTRRRRPWDGTGADVASSHDIQSGWSSLLTADATAPPPVYVDQPAVCWPAWPPLQSQHAKAPIPPWPSGTAQYAPVWVLDSWARRRSVTHWDCAGGGARCELAVDSHELAATRAPLPIDAPTALSFSAADGGNCYGRYQQGRRLYRTRQR